MCELCRSRGIGRREFLGLTALTGVGLAGAGMLGGCARVAEPAAGVPASLGLTADAKDATEVTRSSDTRNNMTATMLWDYLGIIVDKQAMADEDIKVNVHLTDTDQDFLLRFYHGPVLHFEGIRDSEANVTLTGPKAGMLALMSGDAEALKKAVQVEGDEDALAKVMGNIHASMGVPAFNIIEP